MVADLEDTDAYMNAYRVKVENVLIPKYFDSCLKKNMELRMGSQTGVIKRHIIQERSNSESEFVFLLNFINQDIAS